MDLERRYSVYKRKILTECGPILRQRWRVLILLLAFILQSIGILRFVAGGMPIWDDQALYQHGGWYMTQGAVPYRDFFDVKPPLAFEFPALIATFTNDNMVALHLLMILITGATVVGVVLLVADLTYGLTDNHWSALASGCTVLTFPAMYYLPAHGYLPDFLMLFFGLLAIYLHREGFGFGSGASAAISAGFWQIGIIFPILVLALAYKRGRRCLSRSVIGAGIVTTVVVSPFVVWGALEPLFVEVILIPLSTGGGGISSSVLGRMVYMYGYTFPLVVVGLLGGLYLTYTHHNSELWFTVLAVYVSVVVLLLNFQARPDLILPLSVAGIGVGLVVDYSSHQQQKTILTLTLMLLILNPLHFGGVEVITSPLTPSDETDAAQAIISAPVDRLADTLGNDFGGPAETHNISSPYYPPDMQRIYWERIQPKSCHYRFAGHEIRWLEMTGQSPTAPTCGELP